MSDRVRLLTADRGDAARRLDLMLRRHLVDLHAATRTRLQAWIADGRVSVNGRSVRRVATRVALGDVVAVTLPEDAEHRAGPEGAAHHGMVPEDVPVDVLYEDEHLLALNKPAGIVVHPGYRNTTGTLMNALLSRARTWPAPQRPSIVGRLDKLTSGIVVVAKTAAVHALLQRAMMARAVDKDYLALVYGRVNVARGEISFRLRRDPGDRRKVVASPVVGAPSLTRFERLARAASPRAGVSLVLCTLVTGRTHQLRVHLAARGWPIVGDPVYGEPRWLDVSDPVLAAVLRTFPRQALHAWRWSLTHPVTLVRLLLEAPVPHDLSQLLTATGLSVPAIVGSPDAATTARSRQPKG
jgi:23S rRNA pseudouridine1911/1915/1917 synthase